MSWEVTVGDAVKHVTPDRVNPARLVVTYETGSGRIRLATGSDEKITLEQVRHLLDHVVNTWLVEAVCTAIPTDDQSLSSLLAASPAARRGYVGYVVEITDRWQLDDLIIALVLARRDAFPAEPWELRPGTAGS